MLVGSYYFAARHPSSKFITLTIWVWSALALAGWVGAASAQLSERVGDGGTTDSATLTIPNHYAAREIPSRCSSSSCREGGVETGSTDYVNSQLPWHTAVVDSQGNLIPWYRPNDNLGFDKVARLAWGYMEHQAKSDPKTGLKVYLTNSVFDSTTGLGAYWQTNPASTFGQFVDSVVTWYPYSGDKEAISVVRGMLDYQLAHGTTPSGWNWANVPFATGCGGDLEYGKCIKGMPPGFYGGIETDKVGELGIGYVLFYELTGEKKYLDAGIQCADALEMHVRAGDETHTPWPFRVDARTGDVLNNEEYGGMIVAPVRLFAELVRLKQGHTKKYQEAQKVAWNWIRRYPMHNNKWVGYFEDVSRSMDNANQASPMMTAYYILSQPDPAAVDPAWIADVGHMIDWVKKRYGRGPFLGAWAIDEQGPPPDYSGCCSRAGLASDTSRWAAINAMYYERANDGQARRDAYLSLSYSTYFAGSDGRVACCGLDYVGSKTNQAIYWFDDGYGDYIRSFMWALGAMPGFAPKKTDHLLRSSSVVQSVQYGKHTLRYRTFDRTAYDVLRLSFRPIKVEAGGMSIPRIAEVSKNQAGYRIVPLPGGDYVVYIRHTGSGDIQITG